MDDLEPLITAVSGMALSVAQMLTTPLVIAVSPHWGRRWKDLCPLKPGCWGTPNGKGSPSIAFSNSLGSGAQLSGQGGDSGTFWTQPFPGAVDPSHVVGAHPISWGSRIPG